MQNNISYLNNQNEWEQRVASRRNRRHQARIALFKFIRNLIVAGAIIGGGIYLLISWVGRVRPEKMMMTIDRPLIAEIVAEITRPLEYGEVAFSMESNYALLINLRTGRVLFDHRADVQTYPASVTKIMTVLLGLERSNLSDNVTIDADFNALFLSGAMQSGFHQGEVRTMEEVLNAIMLPSGAEATMALANHIAGSYQGFIELMNEKAAELGMNNTNFVTATGLHDDNHYTTANDIAILLKYALENPHFREIFTAPSFELSRPNALGNVLQSTLFSNAPRTTFEGGEILGGRTGFTIPAGRCLASLATDGKDEFILITFGAPDPTFMNTTAHINDALTIYEYFLRNN